MSAVICVGGASAAAESFDSPYPRVQSTDCRPLRPNKCTLPTRTVYSTSKTLRGNDSTNIRVVRGFTFATAYLGRECTPISVLVVAIVISN